MAQIDQYLKFMVKAGASDFHLSSSCLPVFRIDGEMRSVNSASTEPLDPSQVRKMLEEIMPARNLQEFKNKHDTDFAYALQGIGRFRVNIFQDLKGTGAVLRYIPQKIMTMEQLNLPRVVTEFCHLNKGLVLVTGPTGSGKSTNLGGYG